MPRCDLDEAVARLRAAAVNGSAIASEPAGKALLRAVGVATPAGRVVKTPDEAVVVAADLGGPVALKIVAPGVAHKSDVGGVAGPLQSSETIRHAAHDLLARLGGELLVEAWHGDGVQCFVGLSLGGPLGAVLSFGLGGIWVEVLRDVAHRSAPVTAAEAGEALSHLRGAALLQGGRGRMAVDLDALAETLAGLSRLALEPQLHELVREIEVNPLLARPSGPPLALDCAVVLEDGADVSTESVLVAGAIT